MHFGPEIIRKVSLNGKRVQLTRKEYVLLYALATHAGLVMTHLQLIKEIWGSRGGNIQYLRILVRKLRQKVEVDPTRPMMIVSESGVGYRLNQGFDESSNEHRETPSDPTFEMSAATRSG